MGTLVVILIIVGGIVALGLIIRLLGGCLLRVLLALAVVALVVFLLLSFLKGC